MSRSALGIEHSVPLLFVKIGHYPPHHGGLGVIRSLGRLGVAVHAVTERRLTPAAVSRHLSGTAVWPTTRREDPAQLVS